MKETRAHCHFLVKQVVGMTPEPIVFVLAETERARLHSSDLSWQRDVDSLGCHFLVWGEGHQFESANKLRILTGTNRRDA